MLKGKKIVNGKGAKGKEGEGKLGFLEKWKYSVLENWEVISNLTMDETDSNLSAGCLFVCLFFTDIPDC